MKLKTKFQDEDFELGEVVDAHLCYDTSGVNVECRAKKGGHHTFYFNTLKELNEKFEDYEELKEHWYIDCDGEVISPSEVLCNESQNSMEQIGNCFETEEEAEKAVEKLKAWKRLKDGGFVFCGKGDCLDTIKFDYGEAGYNNQDFNLLFGGEE